MGMGMETTWIIWNIIVTLVVAPLIWNIRQNQEELKRQGVLLNRTREEIARIYVTKDELENNMERIMRILNKLESNLINCLMLNNR